MLSPITPNAHEAAQYVNLGSESASDRQRRLARALSNVRQFPAGYEAMRLLAIEAQAYHELNPYPYWGFTDWVTEDRGPLPRCMPLPRSIVRKGAKWLFGKPLHINVPANPDLQNWFREMWLANRMPSRMVAAATRAGVQGGIALKFSYDETAVPPLRFQTLSIIDHCRLYYDPHDVDTLLMARIQYPVANPIDGQWYLYREEWTDESETHFKPVQIQWDPQRKLVAGGTVTYANLPMVVDNNLRTEPDLYGNWEIEAGWPRPNRFGLIPVISIRNVDIGEEWGFGDLWVGGNSGMLRVIDRINLTYHLADQSNQFDTQPPTVYIDLQAEPQEVDRPQMPGQSLSLKSDEGLDGETRKGQVVRLEPAGRIRPHMMDYARDVRKMLLDAVGSVEVDQADFTNKGNLTQGVLTQLYARLIEQTEEKRKTFGEAGVERLLEAVALGLSRIGARVARGVRENDPGSYDVQLRWAPFFQLSENELAAATSRVIEQETAGYVDHERAVKEVALLEGRDDVDSLLDDLEAEANEQAAQQDEMLKAAAAGGGAGTGGSGGNGGSGPAAAGGQAGGLAPAAKLGAQVFGALKGEAGREGE